MTMMTLDEIKRAVAEVERLEREHGLVPVRFEVGFDMWHAMRNAVPSAIDEPKLGHFLAAGAKVAGTPVTVSPMLASDEWAPVYRAARR